jgi:hypothetical protein
LKPPPSSSSSCCPCSFQVLTCGRVALIKRNQLLQLCCSPLIKPIQCPSILAI